MRAAFVLAVAASAIAVSHGGAAAATGPSIRPIDLNPLTVRGLRFRPVETLTVRVVVRGGPTLTKTVRAGARGGFTARFRLAIGACTSYAIRAVGSLGVRAAFTMHPPPCGPAP